MKSSRRPRAEHVIVVAGLRPPKLDGGSDWQATFHWLGGYATLRAQKPAFKNADRVRGILDELPAGKRQMFRIVERDELDALGSDPDAPFALVAAPGFVLDSNGVGPDQHANPGMSHGHHPDMADMNTGLVAAGAGIREGAGAPQLQLTSLAPLVAELLGLDFTAPDGEIYLGLLDD